MSSQSSCKTMKTKMLIKPVQLLLHRLKIITSSQHRCEANWLVVESLNLWSKVIIVWMQVWVSTESILIVKAMVQPSRAIRDVKQELSWLHRYYLKNLTWSRQWQRHLLSNLVRSDICRSRLRVDHRPTFWLHLTQEARQCVCQRTYFKTALMVDYLSMLKVVVDVWMKNIRLINHSLPWSKTG